jgi:phosphoenolpyruvate phosphomutase
MIIARLESLIAGKSVDDALERAFAYVKAGADGVMIHSKEKTGEDIKEFCLRFRKEYSNVPSSSFRRPIISLRRTSSARGASIII